MFIFLFLVGSPSHAVELQDSTEGTEDKLPTLSKSTEDRMILDVKGGIIKTPEGDLPMAKKFRAFLRKGGGLAEQVDPSRVVGRKGKIHVINGEAVWVLIETKAERR